MSDNKKTFDEYVGNLWVQYEDEFFEHVFDRGCKEGITYEEIAKSLSEQVGSGVSDHFLDWYDAGGDE